MNLNKIIIQKNSTNNILYFLLNITVIFLSSFVILISLFGTFKLDKLIKEKNNEENTQVTLSVIALREGQNYITIDKHDIDVLLANERNIQLGKIKYIYLVTYNQCLNGASLYINNNDMANQTSKAIFIQGMDKNDLKNMNLITGKMCENIMECVVTNEFIREYNRIYNITIKDKSIPRVGLGSKITVITDYQHIEFVITGIVEDEELKNPNYKNQLNIYTTVSNASVLQNFNFDFTNFYGYTLGYNYTLYFDSYKSAEQFREKYQYAKSFDKHFEFNYVFQKSSDNTIEYPDFEIAYTSNSKNIILAVTASFLLLIITSLITTIRLINFKNIMFFTSVKNFCFHIIGGVIFLTLHFIVAQITNKNLYHLFYDILFYKNIKIDFQIFNLTEILFIHILVLLMCCITFIVTYIFTSKIKIYLNQRWL